MLPEEIHNFFRPWFYTTVDLSGKYHKSSNSPTGAWVIDDLLSSADLLQKGTETVQTFYQKLSNLINLYSIYLESVREYTYLNDFEEMGEDEKVVYNEVMTTISAQSTLLTEISTIIQTPDYSQASGFPQKISSMSESILLLGENMQLNYFLWRQRNVISQCNMCTFVNNNNSIYCISCGKIFDLDQDELMTEMILNLSIYQEKIFDTGGLITSNKIAEFFFRFLAFLNEEISYDTIVREFDIIYVLLRKTKLKVEKTLYTANQYYVDDIRLDYGWDFIEGLDKIMETFTEIRNSIAETSTSNHLKLWSEAIYGIRKINDGISFYSLMNEWDEINDY